MFFEQFNEFEELLESNSSFPYMKDPVCGMEVSEKNDFVEYEGRKFHFCCASCRWAFENDPKQFVSEQS